MVAAYTPDGCATWCAPPTRTCAAAGERHPRLEETLPPVPAGEARAARGRRARRAGRAGRGGRAAKSVEKAIAAIEERAPLPRRQREGALHDACDEYRDAHAAHTAYEVAEREHRDHTMLRALLELYGDRYDRGKRDRSALDFEDLELVARDLLAGDEGLREAYSSRFEHVLVDEFQDTNRLQNELLALLSRDNLFRVGDENQSIYRFRNADVSVFREHWEEARAAGRAREHHRELPRARRDPRRDRPRLRAHLGRGFEPLREAPGAREAAAHVEPCVELLVVDRGRDAWKELTERRRLLRRVAPRRARLARRRGAPARQADRRAHARGPVVATATS